MKDGDKNQLKYLYQLPEGIYIQHHQQGMKIYLSIQEKRMEMESSHPQKHLESQMKTQE